MRKLLFTSNLMTSISYAAPSNGLLNNFAAGWEFNESSGTSCAEVTGNSGYVATATATNPSIVAGKFGNARHFTNLTSENITTGTTVFSDIGATTSAISYACWVKFNTVQPCIIMRNDGENGDSGFHISIDSNNKLSTFMNVTGNYLFPGGYMITTGSAAFSTGNWYLLAATYDGTTSKVYVNAVEDGTRNIATDSGGYTSLYFNGQSGYHGCYFGHNEQSNNAAMAADLDSFYIWDTCLTPTQISALYNAGSGITYSSFTA